MAQRLRALSALPENLGSNPGTHTVAHNQLSLQFLCAYLDRETLERGYLKPCQKTGQTLLVQMTEWALGVTVGGFFVCFISFETKVSCSPGWP